MNTLYLGPDGRRDFLDEALSLTFPAFTKTKTEYSRILKQRNRLLKNIAEGKANRADLKFWDVTLAKSATTYY
jgi:DNA replication and repair protein RecF